MAKYSKPTRKKIYKIGNVQMDLSVFNGRDSYSDGDIENELLAIAKAGKIDEVLQKDNRWPVLYHFSIERENILNWYPFATNGTCLEIGCGCGGVTGVFTRSLRAVECVEISPRRAEIAAWRHKAADNLKIRVGNLNDMVFDEKFDYVTLIGVLEYAGTFTHTERPYHDFLTKAKSLLKADGVLIIAIENRLGLKYWSGAAEDHTGRRFEGIENYPRSGGVRTFAKSELASLLNETGFSELEWHYPYPDYKLPAFVYSDYYLPNADDYPDTNLKAYDSLRISLFSEQNVWNGIINAGYYDIFANSFLVLARSDRK